MKKIDTIAVIDDDAIFQFTTKRIIEKTNLIKTIYVFSDGKEAIDFFSNYAADNDKLPDIIFLDLNMPIMDGWRFLEEYILLKPAFGKKMTIYIVSSSAHPEDLARAQAISEVTGYVVKPISTTKFTEIINILQQ